MKTRGKPEDGYPNITYTNIPGHDDHMAQKLGPAHAEHTSQKRDGNADLFLVFVIGMFSLGLAEALPPDSCNPPHYCIVPTTVQSITAHV